MIKKFLSIFAVACLGVSMCSCELFESKDDDEDPEVPENPGNNNNNSNSGTTRVDPTAYFPFDGNFDDLSGNEYYGYGSPEPGFTDGVTAGTKALSFTKTGQQQFVIGNSLIDTHEITVCFWAKNISEGNIFHVTTTGGSRMMAMGYRDGHLKYVPGTGGNRYESEFLKYGNFTHKSIEDGKWHHIAITSQIEQDSWPEVKTTLYVDGKIMDTVTEGLGFAPDQLGKGSKFILGGEKVPSMQIAHLRIYDYRQLSEKEIKNLYDSKK